MDKRLKNAVVGQSGGPTAAINATLAGVILGASKAHSAGEIGTLYGMKNGIDGLQNGMIVDLASFFEDQAKIELLSSTPAAALGSCRKKLPKVEEGGEIYDRVFSVLKENNIGYFFYIGGNDSMDTVAKMNAYAQKIGYDLTVIGVPKTIDNDLVGTDHTPGFGSAAKYIATTVQEIICDCAVYTVPAVTIVEIMGRDAGWLTAASGIGRIVTGRAPDYIYLPERTFSMEDFMRDVRTALDKHPNVVIAVSEGVRFADGRYVGEGTQSGALDAFGHKYLAGTGKALELAVKAEIGCKVRSIELNLPQRCAAHLASGADIEESLLVGETAFDRALAGLSGHMMAFERAEGEEYAVRVVSNAVAEVANKIRYVPDEFICKEGNNVTDACLAYLLPLIRGERKIAYKDGLPVHCVID